MANMEITIKHSNNNKLVLTFDTKFADNMTHSMMRWVIQATKSLQVETFVNDSSIGTTTITEDMMIDKILERLNVDMSAGDKQG